MGSKAPKGKGVVDPSESLHMAAPSAFCQGHPSSPSTENTACPLEAPPWTPGPAFTGSGPIKTSLQSETREGGDSLQLFFCAANRWLPPSSLVSAPHPPP